MVQLEWNMFFLSLADLHFIQSGYVPLALQFGRLGRLGRGCGELDKELG